MFLPLIFIWLVCIHRVRVIGDAVDDVVMNNCTSSLHSNWRAPPSLELQFELRGIRMSSQHQMTQNSTDDYRIRRSEGGGNRGSMEHKLSKYTEKRQLQMRTGIRRSRPEKP